MILTNYGWLDAQDFAELTGITLAEAVDYIAAQTGYICKQCGGPSPIGVGYTSDLVTVSVADNKRVSCDCGYSRKPVQA